MKSLVDLDLNQNKLQNAVIGGGTQAPSNPVEGQIYFNTSSDTAFIYDGSDWVPLSEGGVTGVKGNNESTYRTGNVNITAANVGAVPTTRTVNSKALSSDITLTASDVGAATSGHIHGFITNSGSISESGSVAIASGDKLVIADYSDNDRVSRSTIAFNGTTVTKALTQKGTFETFVDLSSSQALTNKTYNGYTLAAAAEKGVDDSISSGSTSTNLPTSAAVASFVSSEMGGVDAMRFKGTIGTGGTVTALPSTHKQGDTYRVITAGTYAGQTCEIGDLIIALGTSGTTASDWTVAQTNIDGAITSITGTSPISVTGSGSSRAVAHENSGVTAASKGDTSNQTPTWGDTFKVPSGTVNATGHLTAFADHTVTIPSATATNSAAGLMSAEDKASLQYISQVISQSVTGVPIAYGGEATLTAGQTSKTIPLSLHIGTETILCQPLTLSAYDNNGNQIMVNVVKHNSGSTYDFTVSIPTAVSYDITLRYTYSRALQ